MSYVSLYNILKNNYPGSEDIGVFKLQEYFGYLYSIFNDLEKILSKETHSVEDIHSLILHPPRIIRAIIDSDTLEDTDIISTAPIIPSMQYINSMTNAIHLCCNIYNYNNRRNIKLVEDLVHLKKDIQPILNTCVHQSGDYDTWIASEPRLSSNSASRLSELMNSSNKPLLFIPLAHGGVSAGVDVFMRYNAMSNSESSICYPIRFSKHKLSDTQPMLCKVEKEYLTDMAQTRLVVLFDEDSSCKRSSTIVQTQIYLKKNFGISAYGLVNYPVAINDNSHVLQPR